MMSAKIPKSAGQRVRYHKLPENESLDRELFLKIASPSINRKITISDR